MHTFNMMRKRLRFWFVTMMLALMGQIPFFVNAQNPQTIEVGPHFGVTSYYGELNTWRNLQDWDWKSFNQFDYDLGAVVRFNYDSRWSFRLDYSYTRLRACDEVAAWLPGAKLNFQSQLHDIGLMVEFNFLNYYTGRPEASVSPYIFAGVSGFMFDTRPFTGNKTIDTCRLLTLDTEYIMHKDKGSGSYTFEPANKNKYGLSIPFGVGCKFSLSQHLAATLEWRMHYSFTDYLDDVSGVYPANGKHPMMIARPKTDEQGNVLSVPAPLFLSEVAPNGIPLYDFQIVMDDPSNPPANVLYDFADPSGVFREKQQRGNHANNDGFGMINLSITWKFVIPGNSACKMNIE